MPPIRRYKYSDHYLEVLEISKVDIDEIRREFVSIRAAAMK
jgi:hypothetical protein